MQPYVQDLQALQINWGSNMSRLASSIILLPSHTQSLLLSILEQRQLSAVFQPIVNLTKNEIYSHEGLIRGPSNTSLHSPLPLFESARNHNLGFEMEHLSRQIVLESFAASQNAYKLFINVSPESLIEPRSCKGATLAYIQKLGLDPTNVVIELTESSPTYDYELLRKATDHYRSLGFEIAIDDLGEGFSSLRLWSELSPEYVKVDKHFINDIDQNPVKLEFVRSIAQIAKNCGSQVIAEGIETQAQLAILKDLGITYGQGYFLGKPQAEPLNQLSAELKLILEKKNITVQPCQFTSIQKTNGLEKLTVYIKPVNSHTTIDEIYNLFEKTANLYSIPVVDDGIPLGLINRYNISNQLSRQYAREIYGKKSCMVFTDSKALIVEKNMSLQAISNLITGMEPHHLSNGFIVTDQGRYIGVSSGHALLREITEMQIIAARYANPLTLLPGNVPIHEHMDRLIDNGITFWACYCDLDNFKPFNDMYGFRRGDEIIQYTGKLLQESVQSAIDFVGHVGGDDFIILFQSEDWETRCQSILASLAAQLPKFYDKQDRLRGGIRSKDRQGNEMFNPFMTMSIGVVRIDNAPSMTHHNISAAICKAKKQAKAMAGNSLFVERRKVKVINKAA